MMNANILKKPRYIYFPASYTAEGLVWTGADFVPIPEKRSYRTKY